MAQGVWLRMAFVLPASLALAGCGGGENLPETAAVRGAVTYRGQALSGGTVTFHPQDNEQAKPGYAEVQPDGTYRLSTYQQNDGAVLGTHIVTVEVFPGQAGGAESALPGSESTLPSPIPVKYRDPARSPLKFEVKAGSNTFDLQLSD